MANWKPGLQKKVSSIFDGVPVPGANNQTQQVSVPQWKLDEDSCQPIPQASVSSARTVTAAQSRAVNSASIAEIPAEPSQLPQDGYDESVPQFWNQIQGKFFTIRPQTIDTRQKVMMGLIPILIVMLVLVLISAFKTPQSRFSPASSMVTAANAFAESPDRINWQIPTSMPVTIRDPMQVGSSSNSLSGATELVIKGIVYSNDKPSAVIGTQIVCEGAKILGATIVNIKQDCVEFEQDGRKWTQRVQK